MVSEFFRNVGYGEGGVIVELQPFHKVGDLQGDLFILQQPAAEETFVGQLQQQGTLGVAALGRGKAAQTLGQIQKLDKQDIDPAVCGEGSGLGQNVARAGGIMKTGGGFLLSMHTGLLVINEKVGPVKRQFPLRGAGPEMTFPGEKKQELAGGETMAATAGLDMQGALGHGDKLIGIHDAPRMQKFIFISQIACGQKRDRPGGVGYQV